MKQAINMTMYAKDVDKVLGSINAIANVGSKKQFMDSLITYGANRSMEAFKERAATFSASSHLIDHMYDWGTKPGSVNYAMPLWNDYINGSGNTKTLRYDFKKSVMPVPERPGIDLQREHIFYNKALVMETGMTVHIAPVYSDVLIIPFGNNPPSTARAYDLKRGFTFSKTPVSATPGAQVAGNFTKFWYQYYTGDGAEVFRVSIEEELRKMFAEEMAQAEASGEVFNLEELKYRMTRYQGKVEKRLIAKAVERERNAVQ